MKKLALVAFLLLILVGCSRTPPDDPNPVVPASLHVQSVGQPGQYSTNFDFYIQATSYMAGFSRAVEQGHDGEANYFAAILSLLSSTVDQFGPNRPSGTRNYFRFDVTNLDGDRNVPYILSRVQFEQEAAANPLFFSIPWYFEQDGRNQARFRLLYNEPFVNHYRTNFISDTISRANSGNISVIVTDMTEHNFNTAGIVNSLSAVINDPNNAVFAFAFRLPFIGEVYDGTYPLGADMPHEPHIEPWAPVWYEGTRPLYILVMGDAEDVKTYSRLLLSAFDRLDGLEVDYTLLHRSNAFDVVSNFTNDTSIVRGDYSAEIYPGGPQISWYYNSGLQAVNHLVPGGTEALDEHVILYLDVSSRFSGPKAGLDIAIPFAPPLFWEVEGMSFYLTHTIEFAPGGGQDWQEFQLEDRVRAIMENSSIGWRQVTDEGSYTTIPYNALTLNLRISLCRDTHSLRTIGNYARNRFRITTYVRATRDVTAPSWLHRYAYSGLYALINEPSIYGSYTIGITEIMSVLSQRAANFDEASGVVAKILAYIVVDQ